MLISPQTKDTLVQMRELTFCFNHWEYQSRTQFLMQDVAIHFQHILDMNWSDLFAFHLTERGKMCIYWVTYHDALKLIEELAL